ncbi:MAG: hypothetical protein JRG80_09920 [Deltaproteobacteria bacterium]|nr:hypothetical protein [Deltaproteobacteria bacterium]MBW2399579.1 hypothetical protein [Deltaproteobacteria bacterium]
MERADPQPDSPAGLRSWLDGQGFAIALRLTLLDLLLAPIGQWNVRAAVLLIASVGLLHGGVLRSPATWLTLSALAAWRVFADWPMSDNHAYLLSYWCLAIFIALVARDPARALARSGRLLVGLVMALSVLWKGVLSPDYDDERFFRTLLLTDPRFEDLTLTLGGMREEALNDVRDLLETGLHETEKQAPASLETDAVRRIAAFLTWATLGIEGSIALLFLLPTRIPTGRLRDWGLFAFCAGTYAIAPVPGFGWLLLSMGIAQCPDDARTTRWLYLACFALVLLHDHVPWFDVLPRPLG